MPKTIPFNEIEKWLEQYPRWKQRIETIKSQLSHIPGLTARLEQVAIHGQGQKNESVLNEVIKRLQLREEELPFWMIRVEVMEGAIKTLLPEDQHFVELKYMQHLSNDDLMDRFHLSASMLYRKRQDVLQQIYEEVGGETSVLWVPWKKNDA
uniref:Uncharacterized protein n=2 Tax=Paenibacillus athensensis TaxID=1967502 RepID=A0A4Y8PZN4_9BACL